jgi:hypothetical protein
MFSSDAHKNAFKRVLSDPARYGINIRPMKDCVTTAKEWAQMSRIVTLIYIEYERSIPIPVLTEIFYDTFSDLSVKDPDGNVICKLAYKCP